MLKLSLFLLSAACLAGQGVGVSGATKSRVQRDVANMGRATRKGKLRE